MKQKLSRVLFIKTENTSVPNTPVERRKRILPEGVCRKRFKKNKTLTGWTHPSGLKTEAEVFGARGPRRSPAAIHGEAGGSEGTSVLRAPFRVGWWWWWSSASTTSTVAPAPANGGSGVDGARRRGLQALN